MGEERSSYVAWKEGGTRHQTVTCFYQKSFFDWRRYFIRVLYENGRNGEIVTLYCCLLTMPSTAFIVTILLLLRSLLIIAVMSSTENQNVVEISFHDLVKISTNDTTDSKLEQDLLLKIGQAFGDADECLGILAVTHVPNLEALRNKLLPMARDLALLPKEELEKVTDETSGYQVGWSHGREKLEGDKLDLAKGSFYANPLTDNLLQSRPNVDPSVARAHPEFYAPNVWPTTSSSTSLADFEHTFKELGLLVCHVGRMLARLCDAYVKSKVSKSSNSSFATTYFPCSRIDSARVTFDEYML